MPQLRSTLTNIALATKLPGEHGREKESRASTTDKREKESGASTVDGKKKESGASTMDPMLLALSSGQHPTVVEMGILRTVLTNTIVDGGSGVNVLPKDTWRLEEVGTADVVATYIPIINGGSARDQTVGSPDGTTNHYRNTTVLARLGHHPAEEERI